MGDVNEAFRGKLNDVLNEMSGAVEAFLVAAVEAKELSEELDTKNTARFIVNSWEGALVTMKVAGDTEPLALFDEMVFEVLLGSRIN